MLQIGTLPIMRHMSSTANSPNTATSKLQMLDADLLMALDALLEDQNVTQAARRLGITQSAMSARLNKLRTVFEDRLFVATSNGRGVVATPRALSMRTAVSTALAALQALVESSDTFDPLTSTRTFTIAMRDNPASILGPGLIARCQRLAPKVRMALILPDHQVIQAAMQSGAVDLLIDSPTRAHADWLSRKVVEERFATAQRKGHPRGAGPLDLDAYCKWDHLLVSADGGSFHGLVDDVLDSRGRKRRVAASVQSYALAPMIVETSDLLCTLPRRLLARFSTALDLFDPPFELVEFQLSAFWHARSQDDPAHRWLRDQIVEASRVATAT
jgi:DNA-binding transcriptional LysR family regulator